MPSAEWIMKVYSTCGILFIHKEQDYLISWKMARNGDDCLRPNRQVPCIFSHKWNLWGEDSVEVHEELYRRGRGHRSSGHRGEQVGEHNGNTYFVSLISTNNNVYL